MSTTPPKEKAAGYGSVPDTRKVVASSIGSDSDDSHQYVTGDVFAQGGQQQFYEPIAEYEGRHRYDPTAQWTEAEEKRLVRRVGAECFSFGSPCFRMCTSPFRLFMSKCECARGGPEGCQQHMG